MLRGLSLPLLMVDEAGYLVITDFRWARQLRGEQSYSMVGLPEYLAPEQARQGCVVRGGGAVVALGLGHALSPAALGWAPEQAVHADREDQRGHRAPLPDPNAGGKLTPGLAPTSNQL